MNRKHYVRPNLEMLEDRLALDGALIPALSSLPAAAAVLYLDFDG